MDIAKLFDYLPDWGMYTSTMECSKPQRELDKVGLVLIQTLLRKRSTLTQIRTALQACRKVQEHFRSYGADDTEGREALWYLMKKCCETTGRNHDSIWDKTYIW